MMQDRSIIITGYLKKSLLLMTDASFVSSFSY